MTLARCSTVLLLSIAAVACIAGEQTVPARPVASAPSAAPQAIEDEDRRASGGHCRGLDPKHECARDPRCYLMSFTPSGDGPTPQVLHHTCMSCFAFADLRGVPRQFCRLRAEGRHAEACALLHPREPERCARFADAGVSDSK
jgi:hypothetical protein